MRCSCAALLVLVPSLASAGSALDKPAFTATPAELLAEAKKAPPSPSGAVLLRQDDELSFDDKGDARRRSRFVVAITSQDGEEGWEGIWREYRPWHQDKPVIRARVISPSGRATDVDTSKVVDEPNRIGQQRHVAVQLPPLEVGSVIEEEVTLADRTPFPGGHGMMVAIAGDDPVLAARVTISAPAALKAKVVERSLPAKGRHAVAGGRETWSYSFGRVPALDEEVLMPEEAIAFPMIGATSSASWKDAAKAYAPAVAFAQPAELPHGDSREVAAAAKAWLHHHVRYVGGDLLDDPFDGVHLDAVVQRGTADTGELGALMVALLRNAGITADFVLVDRGPAYGSDKDEPWLGAFDHVLVRARIGGQEVWIDPEDPDLAVGQLRAEDQGRRALSIADGALVATPIAAAADNTIREVRTFDFPALGAANVTEVSREGGVFEEDQRRWVRESSAADVRKGLAEYLRTTYGGELTTLSSSAPDDFAKPFEMTLAIARTDRAATRWSGIDVWLYASDTLGRLDPVLREHDATRTHDLRILRPHIYEIENRIVVPDGFTIPAATPDRTIPVGVYRITEHQKVEGRTLVVTFRLVADKLRLTPAEVTETAKAARELASDGTHLVLEHTGWTAVYHGDVKKGVAELQRLVAAAPKDPLPRARLAQALLAAGDGDGARREAHKAVELGPKDANAFSALGYVLSHDLLGRQFGIGFDRAGALAAYQKAHALDPKHYGAAVELAELLERDRRGWRFEAGADIKAAAKAWRDVVDIDPSDTHKLSLARALLWSGDAAAAEALARKLPASAERNKILVTAVAIAHGADAAMQALDASDRETNLRAATAGLFMLRQYDLARTFAAAGGGATGLPADIYTKIRREDAPYRPTADPKDVALQLVLEQLDPDRAIDVAWNKDVAEDLRREALKSVPHIDGLTLAVLGDMLRTSATFTVEGDSAAWRVELPAPNGTKARMYLASDGKGPKVIGSALSPRGVGQQVLRLAGKNDDAAARLLDWLAQDIREPRLHALWGASLPRTTAAIRLAGALLARDPAQSLAIAPKCLVTTQMAQLACDSIIVDAYIKQKRWAELETFASTTWAPRAPKQFPVADITRADALTHLGRFDDAKQVYDDVLAKFPDDFEASYGRGLLAFHDGKRDDAIQRFTALAQRTDLKPQNLNGVAWLRVTTGLEIPDAVGIARRAQQLEPTSRAATNTLAGVEAEAGDLHTAIVDLRKAVDLDKRGVPDGSDWYVLGRILEQAGLRDDAIAAYRRVAKTDPELYALDTYTLATKRLQALGAKR